MTFEQLSIFVAVAECEHLTQAAAAIGLTPSAVSSAIKTLEGFYGVALFDRVGRRIELTQEGRVFLGEARAVLARVRAAEQMLADMGGLMRGTLSVHASQTIASYWLPPVLMRFHRDYPGVALTLSIGNTRSVASAVLQGTADIGFVEGAIDEPALSVSKLTDDDILIVTGPDHPWADGRRLEGSDLATSGWVMREPGSGTRSAFEAALAGLDVDPAALHVVLELPSNEAVLSAVRAGPCAAVVSGIAAETQLREGLLRKAGFDLPSRQFSVLRHKERRITIAAAMLERLSRDAAGA
ncbi:LysR family transcriptional regulator [Agrobacterium sp. a22-2]|uniref:LysR family transcriptional regulator n=1 Tax=Agrobacterium sp. a22-2 TaxID=2283840 RepID=UPI00144720B9|nr:LysR family transcriptional regulator [Agrobacterium sp. a22-2]NKN38588.1 LysR family transcriptional regulator [Agrobacterium sp. a22-2]